MAQSILSDALKLPPKDRLHLIEDLWESIIEVPEVIELTDAECGELDRRLAAHRENPAAGSSLREVLDRVRHDHRQ